MFSDMGYLLEWVKVIVRRGIVSCAGQYPPATRDKDFCRALAIIPPMYRLRNQLLLLMLSIPAGNTLANMEYDGNVSYGFNDNISNAVSDRDIFEDSFVTANVNVAKLWVPAVGKSLLLSGHLGMERYNDSDGLDRTSYGTSLTYIQRLGLGAYAPRISASLRADYRDFETDMRDGMLYRASVGLEKRFTPELITGAILTREIRTADADRTVPYFALAPHDVFNQSNSELEAYARYTLANNSVVSARYLFRHGEIDASTNPASAFFNFAKAIGQDYQICKACGNYVVYQIDANVHAFLLDWNWALGRDTSASVSYERRVADASGGVTYTGNIFRIQLNRRF